MSAKILGRIHREHYKLFFHFSNKLYQHLLKNYIVATTLDLKFVTHKYS